MRRVCARGRRASRAPAAGLRVLRIGFLVASAAGCGPGGELPAPNTLPFVLEPVNELRTYPPTVADLNRDGADELVHIYQPVGISSGRTTAVVLTTHEGAVIEQINYEGYAGVPNLGPFFRDLTGDGRVEILVPLLRNDSLFVNVATEEGEKLDAFFLIDGHPRQEPDGELRWDPGIEDFAIVDVDLDGAPDLVSVVNTGFARLPRGILAHRLSDGSEIGRAIVGSRIGESIIDDFDGDGQLEILVSTHATNNGAEAGGFDDRRSYLIFFELSPAPHVAWSRQLTESFGGARIAYDDFDGDGRKEVLLASGQNTRQARLELIEPGTWRTLRGRDVDRLQVPAARTKLAVADLNRDARPELLLTRLPDEILAFDGGLEITKRRRLGRQGFILRVLPDLDQDGFEEIAAVETAGGGFLLLGPDFRTKAAMQPGAPAGVMRTGLRTAPWLIVGTGDRWVAMRLASNPWYLVNRFGPRLALASTGLALLGLTGSVVVLRRRDRMRDLIQRLTADAGERGLLLLDRHGAIRWTNAPFRRMLWPGNGRRPRRFDAFEEDAPDLANLCREALAARPPRLISAAVRLRVDGRHREFDAVADPVVAGASGDPHWMVRLQLAATDRLVPPPDWGILAARVAHDVKNPLTSIRLSVQHMQQEYVRRAPAVAPTLDEHVARVERRIEQLRQLTNNLLKFVDRRSLEREETDLNALVRDFAAGLQGGGIPYDITLRLELDEALPRVPLDAEQIRSLLDNLFYNALNAMARRGTITLATRLARDMQFDAAAPTRDCMVLEVLDTGEGIPADRLERIFEPGFSTTAGGSGLGLALVRKIAVDHGGRITVESEPGVGSAFTVFLPIEASDVDA
jgi:nitrogen-specific signal transduction histidine kinase